MSDGRRVDRRIPVLAWVLVAAAALQVAGWAAVNWYRVFGPYLIFKLEDASSIVTGVAPFLLAAAVLVGAARWPAGRHWLYAGAAFAALHGVMRTATDAWWAWRMTDPIPPEGVLQVVLVLVNLIAVTAAALAPLCLAAGLRRAESVRAGSPLVTGGLTVVTLAAAAAGVGLAAREIGWASELQSAGVGLVALGVVYRLLVTLGAFTLALLALTAVRALPRSGIVPEVLIAGGATMAASGLAASWAGQALLSLEAQGAQPLWVFTIPWAIESLGMVLLIVGFAVAGLSHPSNARSSDSRHPPTEAVPG